MKRRGRTAVALAIASPVVLMLAAILVVARLLDSEPVYSVDQVRAGLAGAPRSWLGRTILVEGAWQGMFHLSVCTSTGTCRNGARWVLLKPTEDANLSAPYDLQTGMMSVGVSSNNGYSSVSGKEMLVQAGNLWVPNRPSPLPPEAPTLTFSIPPGVKDVDSPGQQQNFLAALRRAPLVGRFFEGLFPQNNRLRLHVRITPRSCPIPTFVVCFDGVLVP